MKAASTHYQKDALTDSELVGDRVWSKLLGHKTNCQYVRVICLEVDGEVRYGDNRWGCRQERYVVHYNHKPLKRLCSKCLIQKSKSKFKIQRI